MTVSAPIKPLTEDEAFEEAVAAARAPKRCATCKYLLDQHIADGIFASVCGGLVWKPIGSPSGTPPEPYHNLRDLELDWRAPHFKRIVTPQLDTCEHHTPK